MLEAEGTWQSVTGLTHAISGARSCKWATTFLYRLVYFMV